MRVLIDLLPADHQLFRENLFKYIKPLVIKGVPSVVNDLKSFYKINPQKASILGELLMEMCEEMDKDMCIQGEE